MGKVIILGSEKGGVAKTTSTFNLAYALAKEGKKVLAVDFDSQANCNAALYSRRKKHFIFEGINTVTALSFR